MHLSEIIKQAYTTALEKGFWDVPYVGIESDDNPLAVTTKLMLINSELVEAMNIDRAHDLANEPMAKLDFGEELADAVIRLADLAGYLSIDLDSLVQTKMEINAKRPRKHGKRY